MWEHFSKIIEVVVRFLIRVMDDKNVQSIVLNMLEYYAKMTENTLDDEIVRLVKERMLIKEG